MIDKDKIRNIIELFIAWNGETEVIDVANIDSAVDFIFDSMQEKPVSTRDKLRALSDGKQHLGWLDDAREVEEEPVSEPNEQLAETYLAIFDKKFPILPTLKGKQLADYKNFLNKCQQIFGLKEWGIRPIQSKLFEKLTLLWAAWGVEHLQGVGRQDEKEQDIPVSEELEEAAELYMLNQDTYNSHVEYQIKGAFKDGAKWQQQQDQSTIELAEDHAMFAGMEKMKEQIMAKAIDGVITFDYYGDGDKTYGCIAHDSFCLEDRGLKDNDTVRIYVFKEE